MIEQDDLSYYTRREREERRLADKAAENCARKVHKRLADEYARRAQSALLRERIHEAPRRAKAPVENA